jgi:asparagine synthase (glutamine-hydrolysing)
MMVSEFASQEFKVVLSGDGGDELFWGYPGRFSRVLNAAHDFKKRFIWRRLIWELCRIFWIENDLVHYSKKSIGRWYKDIHNYFPDKWLEKIFPGIPKWPKNFKAFNYSENDQNKTAVWIRWNEFLCHLTMVLLKVDRASMYHSLEVRVPLLDLEVISTALKIDWTDCIDINKKIGKLPLRRVLSRYVKHQSREKRGFEVPMKDWLKTSLKPIFEEIVLPKKTILGLEINRKALSSFFDLHISEKKDLSRSLWIILSLALWQDKHFNKRSY